MNRITSSFLYRLDSVIVKAAGWTHIPHSDTNFMYISPYRYRGQLITLKDGTTISKGDWIVELHLDNKELEALNTSYTSLIRLLRGELLALKSCFMEGQYSDIKAVFGITVFYEIAVRQGFTVLDISSKLKRFSWSLWENILRAAFQKGNKKAKKKYVMSKECWISRNQVLGYQ
jgi:hypothetical protein